MTAASAPMNTSIATRTSRLTSGIDASTVKITPQPPGGAGRVGDRRKAGPRKRLDGGRGPGDAGGESGTLTGVRPPPRGGARGGPPPPGAPPPPPPHKRRRPTPKPPPPPPPFSLFSF